MEDDAGLVRRFKQGDETAFDEIVVRYQKRIYTAALRLVSDHDTACDLSQEAFIRAYGALKDFRENSSVFTWLYRIVINLCINHRRSQKIRRFVSLDSLRDVLVAQGADPQQDAGDHELGRAIARAVDSLPERQRMVFILRQYDGLQHDEIAGILGRSVGAIKASYFQAVRKLRRELLAFVDES